MPVHDWTRIDAGCFHDFHQCWVVAIRNALNDGVLPEEFFAVLERVERRSVEDSDEFFARDRFEGTGVIAVGEKPPTARCMVRSEKTAYSNRADRVVVKHEGGGVAAIVEVLSPGHKSGRSSLRSFVERAAGLIDQGINLLVIDLFPPTPRDPQGIHKAIWDEFDDVPYESSIEKPFTVASYHGGSIPTAYVDCFGLGDDLPSAAIFLSETHYILLPLEPTYRETWRHYPSDLKRLIDSPRDPSEG